MKTILSLLLAFLSLTANAQDFVRVEDNHFIKDGKPYYFIGTNFWYGPILGMKTTEGNRKRLKAELDTLHSLGLNNLRILVGAEAGSKNVTSVTPYLQPQRGTINNDVLDGLDFLLSEMSKRNMLAVLYLTNSWDWSGGYGFYLREAGYGDSPDAAKDWNGYCQYAAKMNTDTLAQHIFHRYVQKIVARKNSYTGKLYKDDPTKIGRAHV